MHWPWNRNKELNKEIEAHLKMAVQDRIAAGASEQEALAAARREFGNIGLVKEVTRDMWGWAFIENFFRDIRFASRQLRKSPGFTLTAALTLALGIGGTTAIFSLIDAVMLRSLPVADPASLYRIGSGYDCCVQNGQQGRWGLYSFALFERLKAAAPEFEQLTAFQAAPGQLGVRRSRAEHIARPLPAEYVTGNYFSSFGIRPFAGRLFSPADDRSSAAPVAVLSYQAWRGIYGGDPSLIGSTLIVNSHPFTVIGIAPPGFFGETLRSDPPAIWLPLHQEPLIDAKGSLLDQKGAAWLRVIGRLRPGATIAGLSARLTGVLRQWIKNAGAYPAAWMPEILRSLSRQTIHIVPACSGVEEMEDEYGQSLNTLLGVCGLVLLIACANVTARPLHGAARRYGAPAGDGGLATTPYFASIDGKRLAGDCRRNCRACSGLWRGTPAAYARIPEHPFRSHRRCAFASGAWVCIWLIALDRNRVRNGSRLVCDPHPSYGCAAGRSPQCGRSFFLFAERSAHCAGNSL